MKQPARKEGVALGVAVVFLLALAGCQTLEEQYQEHKGATIGAGAGAATGAVAGAALGEGTQATVIGGLVGALVGGAIGHYAYDKQQDRDETAEAYNYTPEQGRVVNVQDVTVSPKTINPGDTVQLQTTYAVLTPGTQEAVQVKETRKIWHNGELVGSPEVMVQRTGGTYTSTIPLQLPSTAEEGIYSVVTTVQTDGAEGTGQAIFNVG